MRGKCESFSGGSVKGRITPAGAGKTTLKSSARFCPWDHPRRCGENWAGRSEYPLSGGSPPQVRGKPLMLLQVRSERGITPAGAGKTHLQRRISRPFGDHPRRCGENAFGLSQALSLSGSPPQVRGKHGVYVLAFGGHGITPAGAGKTTFILPPVSRVQDHPRRCGENIPTMQLKNSTAGSPPQVRGKLFDFLAGCVNRRITPAGAGKTTPSVSRYLLGEDHPRRCGENSSRTAAAVSVRGSPPQVRGKPVKSKFLTAVRRITPAGAGKTCG